MSFRPTRLSGCVLWLDAAKGITIGTGVSQWNDQSGTGNHVTQATAINQPAYSASSVSIPGRPAITFDGIDDYMILDSFASIATGADGPHSMFVVWTTTDVAASRALLSFGNSTVVTQLSQFGTDLTSIRFRRVDDTAVVVTQVVGTISINVPYVSSLVFRGTTADMVINGLTGVLAGSNDVGAMTLNKFTVGALGRTTYGSLWLGDIFEVLVYNRAVTLHERKHIERYLGNKYRQSISLTV